MAAGRQGGILQEHQPASTEDTTYLAKYLDRTIAFHAGKYQHWCTDRVLGRMFQLTGHETRASRWDACVFLLKRLGSDLASRGLSNLQLTVQFGAFFDCEGLGSKRA